MASFDVSLTLGGKASDSSSIISFALLSDTINTNHITVDDIVNLLIQNITVNDTTLSSQINVILERISLATVVLTDGSTYHGNIQEALEINDIVTGIASVIINEGLTLDDILVNHKLFFNIVQEVCELNDTPISVGTFNTIVSIALTLSDLVSDLYELIFENITIDDIFLEKLFLINSILEESSINDPITDTLSVTQFIVEDVSKDDTVATGSTLANTVTEDISFRINLQLGSDVFEGWVLNPESFAVWNYDNFNFNSVTNFNSQYLMASNQGLYLFGGTLDETSYIKTKIKTASLDFDTSSMKQITSVILGATNSGKVVLKVSIDGDQTVYYELRPSSRNLENQRLKIGKGLYGRYWQFELITKENSTLDLDTFEVLPIIFKRKVR